MRTASHVEDMWLMTNVRRFSVFSKKELMDKGLSKWNREPWFENLKNLLKPSIKGNRQF
jgi:hypothetical protein